MLKKQMQQLVAMLTIVALLLTSVASLVSAAPATQQVRAQKVTGTIAGGKFAEIWLGLEVANPGTVTIRSSWDRSNLDSIGFFVLDANNVATVQSGGRARENNIAAGSPLESFRGGANEQEASFRATASGYTVVVFNETASDANFTLTATNGLIVDASGNVADPNAPVETPAAAEEATDETATDTAAEATPAPVEESAADTAADDATATPTATPAAVATTSGTVRADIVKGELPKRDDQHYLGLEPDTKDGKVTLSLTFDPQDSTELARRLNFWVLDTRGFTQYLAGESLSKIAIAAGSSNIDTASNQRIANFKSVGFGPYTVIVSNTSDVPASYQLKAVGALLVDESGQTLTAQEAVAPVAEATAEPAAETAADTAEEPAAAEAPAATREGEIGGTYTVQSGDTLYLIARDIYGDGNLYEELCAYNKIENCDVIEVGDVVELPAATELGSTATTARTTQSPLPTPAAKPAVGATTALTGTKTVTTTGTVTGTTPLTETSAVTGTTAVTGTQKATTASSATLVDALTKDGRFKNLLAALDAAGLSDTLTAGGPYTVLAPTDAAFAALPTGALQELVAQLKTNPKGQLYQILLYHVAKGEMMSADIEDKLEVQTLQGNTVKFEVDAAGQIAVNGAAVSQPDIVTSDGVIHAIDAVILPPVQ